VKPISKRTSEQFLQVRNFIKGFLNLHRSVFPLMVVVFGDHGLIVISVLLDK